MIEEDLLLKFKTDNYDFLDGQELGVSYNHTPENAPATRIYFQRVSTDHERLIGGKSVIEHVMFDVECISNDMAIAMQLAEAVRSMCTFRGPMGNTWVQACDVNDQNDTYVYHNEFSDDGVTIDALRLELMV